MSALPPRRVDLPAAPEAEAQVVGAVLLDGRAAYEAASAIVTPDMLSGRLRLVWEACARRYEAGAPIDLITVAQDLRDSGAGAMVDAVLLAELSGNALRLDAGALPEHCRIVADVHARRAVTIAAEDAKAAARAGDLGKASRKAREAAAAAEAPGARPKRKRGGPARFSRGDEVELGAALLEDLRAEHGQVVYAEGAFYRYDAEQGIWVAWEAPELRCRVQAYAGAALPGGKALQLSAGRISGTLTCARDQVEQATFFHAAPPGIVFRNVHVAAEGRQIVVRPHAPEHRARAQLPYAYRQGALCPLWLDTLGGVWRDDADMQQKADFLGQFIGACMLGLAWRYERNPVLVGQKGANGKSTILRVLQGLFRSEQVGAVAPQDLRHEYSRSKLRGVLLNVVGELPSRDLMDTAAYKQVISGEVIGGRNPGEPVVFFRPVAGHLYACNELPPVADTSGGPWRRFVPIEFNRSFEGEADKEIGLADRILRTELEGVASWAIDCARVLLERGDLALPPSAAARRDAWRHDSDQVLQWASQALDMRSDGRLDLILVEGQAPPKHKDYYPLSSMDLYGRYKAWAGDVGHARLSLNRFADRLQALGATKQKFDDAARWNVRLKSVLG